MSAYDNWLTTTPEDDEDAADERAKRLAQFAGTPPADHRDESLEWAGADEFSGAITDMIAENQRLARIFGEGWTEELSI